MIIFSASRPILWPSLQSAPQQQQARLGGSQWSWFWALWAPWGNTWDTPSSYQHGLVVSQSKVRSSEEYIFFILNALTTYCSLALSNTNTPHFIFYGVFYHAVLSMGMWVIHKLNDSIELKNAKPATHLNMNQSIKQLHFGSEVCLLTIMEDSCTNLLSN